MFEVPTRKCSTFIPGLGTLEGFEYANGVQQYCGIPYAKLAKRWTRSTLDTSWENDYHDGTILGNDCPYPMVEGDDSFDLVPVPPVPHFPRQPEMDELTGLVMNIVIPCLPNTDTTKYPVMAYVHGGSLLYGGANLAIFDAVNLVSHSISIDQPIICINFNYRVGLGGFLASSAIKNELEQDGFNGCGNFGFTDQQVAFQWIQKYISELGGDPDNVTAVGESAGGISISSQLIAAEPPRIRRAVCMSGLSMAIPAWSVEEHEKLFRAVCRYFDIDPSRDDVLDVLRGIPQTELANATPDIQGVLSGTGNPCLDGWFYAGDPATVNKPPSWLDGFMFGDTYHEGVIFHLNLLEDNFDSVRQTLFDKIQSESETNQILEEYDITAHLPHDEFLQRVEHMCGDAIFKIPNYATSLACKGLDSVYKYHFDQRSRIKNSMEGTAYHAHELLYLFGNLYDQFNESEIAMSKDFATAWISFTYGLEPWIASKEQWKVWGDDSIEAMKNEGEDEEVRSYARMKRVLAMGEGKTWKKWLSGVDALVNKRGNMGAFRKP